jgi:hypothetical protein
MKTLRLFSILLLCSCDCHAQENNGNEIPKIFSLLIEEHKNVQNLLASKIDASSYKILCERLSEFRPVYNNSRTYDEKGRLHFDSLTLTPEEKLYIDSAMKAVGQKTWTRETLNSMGLSKYKLIKEERFPKLRQLDYTWFLITEPVFIRNNSICIVYFDYNCGSGCGHGGLYILRKRNEEWQYWIKLFYVLH